MKWVPSGSPVPSGICGSVTIGSILACGSARGVSAHRDAARILLVISTRPYRGWDDLTAMQAVCSARLVASPGRAAAHPGDMAWWVAWPPRPVERLAETFLLLEVGQEVVGFAATEHEGTDLSVFVSPSLTDTEAAAEFEDEALMWASRGDTAVRWIEFEDEAAAVERWRGRGYLPTDVGFLL